MKQKRSIYSRLILFTLIASQIILFGSRCFSKEWSQTFGGSSHDAGFSVKQTTDGGYIIAGYRDYELSQDVGDVWLIKTDADGNLQWERSFGGAYWDTAFSVQQTTDGGYIIAGEKDFAGTWDPRSDAFLIKTDANGSIQWELTFDRGSWRDWFRSVQLTTDGGYIAAGATSNGWGLEDVYLVKIDSDGTVQWEQTFGGDWTDYAESIQQTSDGGYIMVGQYDRRYTYLVKTDSYGNIQWEKTFGDSDLGFSVLQATDGGYIVLARTVSIGAGGEDAWLAKTDANGNLIWEQTFGGSASDNGRSFQQTVDGGYVIAGHTASFGAGSNDVWLIKTDANGNELWTKTFGGNENDSGNSVQQTTDGGYIIAGHTHSFGAGGQDVYLIYYKPDEFVDVPPGYWAEDAIYKIYEAGITKGCSQSPLMFCPKKTVNRDQMAVFLGRATHDSNFTPPDANGLFADVPVWYWAADWIEQFYADGLTKGCKVDPHDLQSPVIYYCPKYPVTRTTMAIFLLRAKHGANYEPPPATGIFEDVWVNYWAADWIEQLYKEGITMGCKSNPLMYCPANHVTRAQMAVFLARMLGL